MHLSSSTLLVGGEVPVAAGEGFGEGYQTGTVLEMSCPGD